MKGKREKGGRRALGKRTPITRGQPAFSRSPVKSMLGIFPLGQNQVFFRLFSPFFGYIVTAMLPQKRKNRRKNPLFLAPAENPQHALAVRYWQVFWLVSGAGAFPSSPGRKTVAYCLAVFETYSSGDCPGFAPVFPFKPPRFTGRHQNRGKDNGLPGLAGQ